jgi:hypothetical protein
VKRPLQPLRILLALALALLLADLALSLFAIRDGMLAGIPLPPFGEITDPKQEVWLEGLRVEVPGGLGRFDAELGWSWRPGGTAQEGKYVANSGGARGSVDFPPLPEAGRTRILTFGDSFTFGDEIHEPGTFQRILEAIHPSFEVINFGVSAYGTDQAFLRYRRLGRDLGAEVVCIGILLENIGRNVNRYRPLWNPTTGFCSAKPRFVLDEEGELQLVPHPFSSREELRDALLSREVIERVAEHEYWLGRPTVPTGRLSSLMRIAACLRAHQLRNPERLWRDREGEPFQVTLAILEAFHREALADGAKLAPIVVFPTTEDLFEVAMRGESYWDGLFEELERRGIPYVNPIPALVERQREIEADEDSKLHLYFGAHLSTVGNAVVAEELEAWLEAHLP